MGVPRARSTQLQLAVLQRLGSFATRVFSCARHVGLFTQRHGGIDTSCVTFVLVLCHIWFASAQLQLAMLQHLDHPCYTCFQLC
jgi:hypothetical protein